MNLEFSFKTNSSARPQNKTLQEGESIQVFSGESFQIQNPEIVARLVPQDKDLQIVCHDGTSFILKNFLEVDFATEPVLELQGGTPITRHDFLQQTEEIDQDFHIGDINNPTFAFAPLLVIAATAKSPEWSFAKMPLSEEESSETTVQNPQSPRSNSPQPKEKYAGYDDSSFSKATTQNIEEVGIKLAPNRSEDSQSDNIAEANANSVATDFIEIDILKFLDFNNEGIDPPLSITGTIVGDGGTEIEIDDSTGIAIIPKDIFKDDNSVNINIIVDDGIGTKNTTITITETKDGGGETFHLILSQNQVVENREGALIGKLDTDDAGRNHTYEYTLSKDSSNLFEIEGNVLKLKNDVSIDYEAHSESYIIRIVAIDETGHKIEQSMDVWPKDVNEIASLSSIDISTLEDVRVIFDPEDFDNAFEDEDNDYLETIRMDTLPENGTLSLGDNPVTIGQLIDYEQIEDLSFQPNPNWNEGTSFNWSGFDGSAWSAESSLVSISIEAVNDAPIVSVNIGQQLADIGEVLTMNLPEDAFIDIDNGDTLSYSSELPGWLNVDSETGTISGTPTDEHIGDQDITITATDASGKSTSQTFRLNIENINDAPTFTQISNLETDEDASFKLEASDHFNDKDLEYGDTLNYTATLEDGSQLPIWLSIDPQSGTLSGTPENEDVESLNIRITASDGEAQSEQTFSLQINNTNDGPTVVADIVDQTVDEDAAFSLDVSGNFSDEDIGDELAFSAALENGDPLPTWLSIDSATGELSGTPDNGDVGAINV
ncbi:MAG: putative Ig domain-containing protein, partial [Opitutaceae bacterium]|nr:putative Ig domain-containing protein [Opitutaceae bacterium]